MGNKRNAHEQHEHGHLPELIIVNLSVLTNLYHAGFIATQKNRTVEETLITISIRPFLRHHRPHCETSLLLFNL
jgi:hypothetical protein